MVGLGETVKRPQIELFEHCLNMPIPRAEDRLPTISVLEGDGPGADTCHDGSMDALDNCSFRVVHALKRVRA